MLNPYHSYLAFFLKPYMTGNIRIQKKARVLAPVASSIALLGALLCVLMSITGAVIVGAMLAGLMLFCAFVLFLLRRGKFSASSSLFLYGLFLVMFAAIKFDEYQNIYETYVFASLGLFMLVIVGLIAADTVHALIMTVLNLCGIAVLYYFDTLIPLDGGIVTLLAIQSLATCAVITVASGWMCAQIISMQRNLVQETEDTAGKALRQYQNTSSAVAKAYTSASELSAKLLEAAEDFSSAACQMKDSLSDEGLGLDELGESLLANAQNEQLVIKSQENVKTILESYTQQVLASSKSINAILQAVKETGDSTEERKKAIGTLSAMSRDGEEQITAVVNAINNIVTASESMEEMNTLIGAVAERTNMLGMNASIEAAHAGDAGKGFAVVAEEIRSLSEETAESSRTIASILDETKRMVELAVTASEQTNRFFSSLSSEIQQLAVIFSELLSRLQEVASGTSGAFEALQNFSSLAKSAATAANESTQALEETANRSERSRNLALRMKEQAAEMNSACETLLSRSNHVRELGHKNMSKMEELRTTIQIISSES